MLIDAALSSLAESLLADLATTGGTFDAAPWIIGGAIALAIGAFVLLWINRRRSAEDRALDATAGRSDAEITAAQEGDLDGDGFADGSSADRLR